MSSEFVHCCVNYIIMMSSILSFVPLWDVLRIFNSNVFLYIHTCMKVFQVGCETKPEHSAGVEFQSHYSQRFRFSQLPRCLSSGLKIGQVSASVESINRLEAIIKKNTKLNYTPAA